MKAEIAAPAQLGQTLSVAGRDFASSLDIQAVEINTGKTAESMSSYCLTEETLCFALFSTSAPGHFFVNRGRDFPFATRAALEFMTAH